MESAKSGSDIIYINYKYSANNIRIFKIIGLSNTKGPTERFMTMEISLQAGNFKSYWRLMLLTPNMLILKIQGIMKS